MSLTMMLVLSITPCVITWRISFRYQINNFSKKPYGWGDLFVGWLAASGLALVWPLTWLVVGLQKMNPGTIIWFLGGTSRAERKMMKS